MACCRSAAAFGCCQRGRRCGKRLALPSQSRKLPQRTRALVRQSGDLYFRAGDQGLRLARIAQQLALPLEIGADTWHFSGQPEAMRV